MSSTILVTGANDGIGLELVKLLAKEGHTVYLGARNVERGTAAKEAVLKANPSANVHFLLVDITSDESVSAAVETIEKTTGKLDILVNNAGVGHVDKAQQQKPGTVDFEILRSAFETNFYGTLRVTNALIPLISKSESPALLFLSTDMASTGFMAQAVGKPDDFRNHVHWVAYNTSKAALNSYVVSLAATLPKFKVNSITPGYTATKLNGYGSHFPGAMTVEESASLLAKYVVLQPDGPTGKFFKSSGTEMPW